MGKKKEPVVETKKEEVVVAKVADDEAEDTPVIKSLKAVDDKYCAIEVELEREIEKLRKKYDEKQAPLLKERKTVLDGDNSTDDKAKEFGTPGCSDFWITALTNANEFEELLHDCDEQVLKYLDDIQKSYLDPEQPQKGTKLEFTFKENPFFTNTVLFVEAHFDYNLDTYKPYKEPDCIEVKSSVIDWKAGKNITVEKKAKSGADKKGKRKPAKSKEEPIPSFFRIVFNSLKMDDPLPEALQCVYSADDEEDEDMTECHLQNMGEVVQFIDQQFIRYAVRYYTGEACEDDDDDDDEESEEEDDEDGSSDEESEEPAPKPKKGGKAAAPKKGGSGDAGAAGEKTEECKQQ